MNALLVLVGAVLTSGAPVVRLATAPMRAAEVQPDKARFFEQHFAQQLAAQQGIKVISADDVSQILGFERQKQLIGCLESSCAAELAGALGVDALVLSSLARVGAGFAIDVRVLRASQVETIARFSGRAAGEEQLLDLLPTVAAEIAAQVRAAMGVAVQTPAVTVQERPTAAPGGLRRWAWLPGVLGGAALASGAVLLGLSATDLQRISTNQPEISSPSELNSVIAAGQTKQLGGAILVGVGGALVLSAAAMLLWGDAPKLSAALEVGPHQVGLVFAGALP